MLQKNVPDVSYIMDAAQGSVVAQRFFSDDGKPRPKIEIVDGREFISSTTVAKLFRKNHNKVLWDLSVLLYGLDEDFRKSNFFMHEDGSRQPCCLMTREGFARICPEKAAPLKEAVLRAFDETQRARAVPPEENAVPEIEIVNGRAYVNSRTVAVRLGKSHSGMLDSIRRRIAERPESLKAEFVASEYVDAHGEHRPCCLMSRRGFEVLMEARGYRGKAVAVEDAFRRALEKTEASVAESESASAPVPAAAEIAVRACPDSMAVGEDAPRVETAGGRPVVTSLEVARFFKKEHKNVMRCIRSVMEDYPPDERESNFVFTFRDVPLPNGGTRKEPCYLLTKTGVRWLTMRFTGRKANMLKDAVLIAFDEAVRSVDEKPVVIENESASAPVPAAAEIAVRACPESMAVGKDAPKPNAEDRASSIEIAKFLGKRHDHVLRDIREKIKDCPTDFNAPNFGEVDYVDAKGERRPCYLLTREAFLWLSMKYTGKKADEWKRAYAHRFGSMQAALASKAPAAETKAVEAKPAASGQFATTTIELAERFGKGHLDVSKAVHELMMRCPEDIRARNFEAFRHVNGTAQTAYRLSRMAAAIVALSFERTITYEERIRYLDAMLAPECVPAAAAALPTAKAVEALPPVSEEPETPPAMPAAPVEKNGVFTLEFNGVPVRFRRAEGTIWICGSDMARSLGMAPAFLWKQYRIPEDAVRRMPSQDGTSRHVVFCGIPAAIRFCQRGRHEFAAKRLAFMEWLAGTALPAAKGMNADPLPTPSVEAPEDAAFTREYRGTLIRILLVDGEPWTRKLDMLKALGFSTHRRFEIPREFETRACCNDGAIYVSARGVEYFCTHGSPARIERGKAFLQWLNAVVPAQSA